MLKRILVGVNGSLCSQAAAEVAIAWARRHHAAVIGLGIVDVPQFVEPEPVPLGGGVFKMERDAALIKAANEKIAGHLADFERRCAEAEVPCRITKLSGTPETLLAQEAQCADLLVIGKKSRPEELGTVASHVLRQNLRHATRPVLCIGENESTDSSFNSVVVAYDGSPQAAKSLQVFNAIGLAKGREIHLVMVARDSSHQHPVEMAAEYLKAFDHRVYIKIRSSGLSTSAEILAEARLVSAGLIVMGAYGQSPVKELFFGSVTSAILNDSDFPLFLYH